MASWIPDNTLAHKAIFTTENKAIIRSLKKATHELSVRMPDASLCISAKSPNGFLVTSSSSKPASISDDDFIEIHSIENSQLKSAAGLKEPSADTLLHDSLYKAKHEIRAILHIHSMKLNDAQAAQLHIPIADASQAVEKLGPRGELALAGGLLIARDSTETVMEQFDDIYHRKKHLK